MKFLLLLIALTSALKAEIALLSEKAILLNAKTGKVLFEKNSDEKDYPASIVKLATALYIFSLDIPLQTVITAKKESLLSIDPDVKKQSQYRSPPYWLETDATHIGIKTGEEFSVEVLLNAMLVYSANDAANVLAQGIEGSIPAFMDKLNAYLKKLGCTHTFLCNPHGLHHPKMVTTAREMALIAQHALQYPKLVEICRKTNYVCPETNISYERPLKQTNRLLTKGAYYYPEAIGLKTGTTQVAGKTLIAAAENENRQVVAVLLGFREKQKERYPDMIALLNLALKEPMMTQIIAEQGAKFTLKHHAIEGILAKELQYRYFESEKESVTTKISWHKVKPPIAKDEIIGHVDLIAEGKVIDTQQLLAATALEPTFKESLVLFFEEKRFLLLGMFFLFCAFAYHRLKHPKRKKSSYCH